MWWVKTWKGESSTEGRSVQCGRMDLDVKLYSPLSLLLSVCAYISALTPSSPPAIPSTACNPTLHHSSLYFPSSLTPSIPGGAIAWVAGGGRRRDLGAPSQKANRCSPSGVSQMAHIKKSWEGTEKDENIPQDEQATDFWKFLAFLLFCVLHKKKGKKKIFHLFPVLSDLSTSCAPLFQDSWSLSASSSPECWSSNSKRSGGAKREPLP